MCRGCWQDQNAPNELPPNTDEVIDLIRQLYAQPDATSGGPLHVLIDDFNLDSVDPVYLDEHPDLPRTRALAEQIAKLMRPMTLDQRAAVIAEFFGWTKPKKQPEHCPFGHYPPAPVTHRMRYAGTDGVVAWACAKHALNAVAYQMSKGVTVVAEPLPATTP